MFLEKKYVIVIFFIIYLSFTFLPVFSLIVESITIPTNGENEIVINLGQGELVEGSISISGTDYISIFEIKDPMGERVEIFTKVSEGTSFELPAIKTGDYVLAFKNFDRLDSIVTISYEIESGLSSIFLRNPYQIIGIIVIVSSILIGAIIFYRIKK